MHYFPTLTIFPAPSSLGQQLAKSIETLGISLGFQVSIANEFTQTEFLKSCLCDSILIVDASIEDDRNDIYRIATIPNAFDHFLVVSRTYLPLNFVPVRLGGAPPYPYPHINLPNGQRAPGFETFTWNNQDILNWLQIQLSDLQQTQTSPRLTPEEFSDLSNKNFAPLQERLNNALEERSDSKNIDNDRVFISYRGKYYREVQELARRIESGEFHQGKQKSVRLLVPGELAWEQEILSEGRRWMVLNLLHDELSACEELWVYQTDDYLNSWWTLGEIVVAACINKRIRIYLKQNNSVIDNDGTYSINLTKSQIDKLALIRSNTHPSSMALDTNQMLGYQKWIFKLGLGKFLSKNLLKMIDDPDFQRMFPADENLILEMKEKFSNPDKYRSFINDRVFDKKFWNELCIEPAWAVGKEPIYHQNVDLFINAPETQTVRISNQQAELAIKSGRSVKASDRKTNISIEEYPPRYLWKPSRNEIVINISGGLERLPTYVVA